MQVEGKNAILELLAAGQPIDRLFLDKGIRGDVAQRAIETVRGGGGRVEFMDAVRLDRMSMTAHHQGWIGITREFEYSTLEEVLAAKKGDHHFLLLLDGIEDPHNLGACIRVAECAGADGIVIPDRRSAQVNETVIKVAAGATAHVKIARVGNLNEAVRVIKDAGIFVFGAELGGESMYRTNLAGDIAIVIGSEGEGMHRLTKDLCDGLVTIPMFGAVNSLNASVACGVVMYEAIRQRIR